MYTTQMIYDKWEMEKWIHFTSNFKFAARQWQKSTGVTIKKSLLEFDDPVLKEDILSFYLSLGKKDDGSVQGNSVEA